MEVHQLFWISISGSIFYPEAAQEFRKPKTNLKIEASYLKFIFEIFLMQNYLLNCHN